MNDLENLDILRDVASEFAFIGGLLQALAQTYELKTGDGIVRHDVDWEEMVRQFCWRTLASDTFSEQLVEWQRAFLSAVMECQMLEDRLLLAELKTLDLHRKPQPILNIESEAECNSAIQGILKWLDRDDEDADADAELTGVWKGPLDKGVLQYIKYGAVYGSDSDGLPDRERVSNSVDRKGGQLL